MVLIRIVNVTMMIIMKVIHVRCENISLTMKTFRWWGEDKYIILYGVA